MENANDHFVDADVIDPVVSGDSDPELISSGLPEYVTSADLKVKSYLNLSNPFCLGHCILFANNQILSVFSPHMHDRKRQQLALSGRNGKIGKRIVRGRKGKERIRRRQISRLMTVRVVVMAAVLLCNRQS